MFDFFKGDLVEWLGLFWAVCGGGVIYLAYRIRNSMVKAKNTYSQMVHVLLGDATLGVPGISERLKVLEADATINQTSRKAIDDSTATNKEVIGDIQRLREDLAINTATTTHLQKQVRNQEDSLAFISKELTHNGGGSVKDMARDAARNSRTTLSLMRSRDDMDPNAAFYFSDEEGRYTWVSDTYVQWTRLQQNELMLYGWMNSIHSEDRDDVRAEWDDAIEDDRDFYMEYRMWTREREPFWVRAMARKVTVHEGTVSGWYGRIVRLTADEIVRALAESKEKK